MPDDRLDLIVKGGHLIDPGQGIGGVRHLGVQGGRVVLVSEEPIAAPARRTIDASGMYVSPGFVDLHTHVFAGTSPSTNADRYGLANGVTASVDAGSSGWSNVDAFRTYVVPAYQSRVYAFVHLSAVGVTVCRFGPELADLRFADVERTVEAIGRNRPFAVGVKLRIAPGATGPDPKIAREALRLAREAADLARVPLMVHVANTTIPLGEIFDALKTGDVVTHFFNGSAENVFDSEGRLRGEVRAGMARGVIADVGHAVVHFDWRIARRAMAEGIFPHTISTDVHNTAADERCYTLPAVMSQLYALGMPLVEVVSAVTDRAASAIGRTSEVGTLAVGRSADIVVFGIEDGRFSWYDAENEELQGDRRIAVREVFVAGALRRGQFSATDAVEFDPVQWYDAASGDGGQAPARQ